MIRIVPTKEWIMVQIKAADTNHFLKKVAKYGGQVDVALMTGETRPLLATTAPSVLVSFGDEKPSLLGRLRKVMRADYIWDMFAIGKSLGAHPEDEAEEKAIQIFETILDPIFEGVHYDGTAFMASDGNVYQLPSMDFSFVSHRLVFVQQGTAVYHCQYTQNS